MLLAFFAFGSTAWAQFSGGTGTETDPYLISSVDDWNTLADNVNDGTTYSGLYFQMTADISTISKMVGESESNSFRGTFDGQGHTLAVSITNTDGEDDGTAPVRYLKDATIMNLHVTGTLKSDEYYIGGIAGCITGSYSFYSCRSSVTIYANY